MPPIARPLASAPIAVLVGLACVACQPASRPGAANDAPAAATQSSGAPRAQPGDAFINGVAMYRERIKMPPGASLRVELLRLDGAPPRLVASTHMPDVAGPPIRFSLPYAAARVDAGSRYGIRASLLGPDGERWMATAEPVPVVPGSGQPVEVLLRMARDARPPAANALPTVGTFHWECGDLGVMSRHPGGAATVRLDANGRAWTLPLARSASGARYADGAGTEFWTKGGSGTLTLRGEPPRECVQARQPSPWNTALLRGVAFRAVGNEPGWHVEVDAGGALRATLDYGERTLSLPGTRRRGDVFEGRSGDEPVALEVRRTACSDGMSGQRFEAAATLRVGSRAYEGCGAFLDD